MKIQFCKKLLVWTALMTTLAVTARGGDIRDLAAQLTEECKKEAEKAHLVSAVVDQASPESAGRAKEDLKRLAAAGFRLQQIMEKGIPQDPAQKEKYVRDLQNALGESHMLARSVERDFERSPNVADQVLSSKLGPERLQKIFNGFDKASSSGSSGPKFDGQVPDESMETWVNKSLQVQPVRGTQFFQTPQVRHDYHLAPPEERKAIERQFGTIPGGVVLDGVAQGVGPIRKIVFDGRSDSLIVNDDTVYFVRVPRKILAAMIEALAKDEKMGVSLSTPPEIYGKLPKDSPLAWNLMMADNFLGSIAFGQPEEWLTGYKFADNYHPQAYQGNEEVSAAVFFRFTGVEFQIKDRMYQVVNESFEARTIPLKKETAANGGLLASESGIVPTEWEQNTRHLSDNINWYRREKLIDQTFGYTEAATFLRAARNQNIDLFQLAQQAEAEAAIWEALH